jgi:DNA-binding GntR family transcriptional regulator
MGEVERRADLSHGQDAYQRLIGEIRAGSLKPGDRLLEAELAMRLGISRTPVREAIRQLEGDGLVAHAPRTGATVRRLDYSEVTELYEMRTVLEATAARLAARAASEVELSEMEALNTEMVRAEAKVTKLYELNRQFHRVLLDASRNRYLASSVAALQKTLLILGPSTMEETGRAAQAVAEHADIVSALRARDEAWAEAAMRRHMQGAHRMRLRQLRAANPDLDGQDDL